MSLRRPRFVARDAVDEQVLYAPGIACGWAGRCGCGDAQRGDRLAGLHRREIARATRSRWLAGGQQDGWTWDAFVAAPGCLLADLVPLQTPSQWLAGHALGAGAVDRRTAGSQPRRHPARASRPRTSVGAGQRSGGSCSTWPLASWFCLRCCPWTCCVRRRPSPWKGGRDPPRTWHGQSGLPSPATRELLRAPDGRWQGIRSRRWKRSSRPWSHSHELPEEISRPVPGTASRLHCRRHLAAGLLMMFLARPRSCSSPRSPCARDLVRPFCDGVEGEKAGTTPSSPLAWKMVSPGRTFLGFLAAVGWFQGEHRRRAELHDRLKELERERQIVLGSLSWFILRGLSPGGDADSSNNIPR